MDLGTVVSASNGPNIGPTSGKRERFGLIQGTCAWRPPRLFLVRKTWLLTRLRSAELSLEDDELTTNSKFAAIGTLASTIFGAVIMKGNDTSVTACQRIHDRISQKLISGATSKHCIS